MDVSVGRGFGMTFSTAETEGGGLSITETGGGGFWTGETWGGGFSTGAGLVIVGFLDACFFEGCTMDTPPSGQ